MRFIDYLLARGLHQGRFSRHQVARVRAAVRMHRKAWLQGTSTPELSRLLASDFSRNWRLAAVMALARLAIEQPTLTVWGALLVVPAGLITLVTFGLRGARLVQHLFQGAV